MNKASSTKQMAATVTHAPSVIISDSLGSEDFVIVCTSADNSGLNEAVHALYYLPENYKLMVISDEAAPMSLADHGAIKGRIQIKTAKTSVADALVYGEHDTVVSESKTPRVIVSRSAASPIATDNHDFTISADSPEAFASAILAISRNV